MMLEIKDQEVGRGGCQSSTGFAGTAILELLIVLLILGGLCHPSVTGSNIKTPSAYSVRLHVSSVFSLLSDFRSKKKTQNPGICWGKSRCVLLIHVELNVKIG